MLISAEGFNRFDFGGLDSWYQPGNGTGKD
jgi:hypothetical protein